MLTYSVMQSDGNSFCGYVDLDSFKKCISGWRQHFRPIIHIKEKIYSDYYYEDFNYLQHSTKMHKSSRKTLFYEFLVVLCCISYNVHFLQSLLNSKICIIKIPKYFLFIFFVSKAIFIPVCHVKAVQDDISTIIIPIWLHHTFSVLGYSLY